MAQADSSISAEQHLSRLRQMQRLCAPTVKYWFETEVHVYAFSIAANVLLSFYPFLIVLISVCRHFFRSRAAEDAILLALNDFFPGAVGEFIGRNLLVTVAGQGPIQLTSIFLLFFTANGIFEPLEVALNRVWGITTNRSFFRNQVLSLGLIFLVGALAMLSAVLTGANASLAVSLAGEGSAVASFVRLVVFKTLALPISILILFLVYWLLPNRRLSPRQLLPVSVVVGIALELLKYVNLLTLPWLRRKLEHEYGPFKNSVTIVLWSFLASLIVLAGAEWSARHGVGIGERNDREGSN